MNEQTLAHGLGWFSIGLGAAILIAPRRVAQAVGVENKHDILQMVGVREIITGIGILSENRPARWLWGRVAGDAMDIALLASAPKLDGRTRAGVAMAAVGGIALVDSLHFLDRAHDHTRNPILGAVLERRCSFFRRV